MTENQSDRYRESDPGDSEYGIEASEGDIDGYAARAALDSSGVFFRLLGEDTDGRGHYAKENGDEAEVAVLDADQDIVDYLEGVDRGRLESYIWEKEWEVLTDYGAAWLDE